MRSEDKDLTVEYSEMNVQIMEQLENVLYVYLNRLLILEDEADLAIP